ncbi:hypothetical protein ABZW18_31505 [Streptomyces sp. NPDC004647]|uniref:hypothetical protein n=1 Tax=Streptomyces sp. NPDC004647 TaxID=3154671 RepID=UPI0033A15176
MPRNRTARPQMPDYGHWNAPRPGALLDWQRRQANYTLTNLVIDQLTLSFRTNSWTLMPVLPGRPFHESDSARVLASCEARRLTQARTYSLGRNVTGMAVAASGSAPKEHISGDRPPSPTGFMVFKDPIGSHTETVHPRDRPPARLHFPIVAVSWSLWNARDACVLDASTPLMWLLNSPSGALPVPDALPAIWINFYTPRITDFSRPGPDETVGVGPDGRAVTAAQMAQDDAHLQRSAPDLWGPLHWHNEIILPLGQTIAEPVPETPLAWAAVVYTAWQIMQQTGKNQLVDVRRNTLPPAARKKEKAKAKKLGTRPAGDGTVRIIDLAAPVRPRAQDADRDAAGSEGRRKVEWSCRWPVPPHRRMTCTNPHLHHKLGDDALEHHEHREDIMPFRVKGPADKPLRVKGGTTRLFELPDH